MAVVERGGQRQTRRRGRNTNSSSDNYNNNKATQGGASSRKNNKSDAKQQQQRQDHASSTAASATPRTPTPLLIPPLSEKAPVWYLIEDDAPFRHATIVTHPPPPSLESKSNVNKDSTTAVNIACTNSTNRALVQRYRDMADEINRKEVENFANSGRDKKNTKSTSTSSADNSNKDRQWLQSTIAKGTLKDRIAAMAVMVSSDPIHRFYVLDGLLQMTGCSSSAASSTSRQQQQTTQQQQPNSRVAQMAAEALVDLFLHTLVPTNRKLVQLEHRPLYLFEKQTTTTTTNSVFINSGKSDKNYASSSSKSTATTVTQRTLSPRLLLLWRFEELVLNKYNAFLRQYMNATLSSDNKMNNVDPAQKTSTLYLASTLLQTIPTCESVVLQMLVNKLGDPHKKVAATAGHALRLVLQRHAAMQHTIAREVQQLAHRPHLSDRALYNCIIFLNQLTLSERDTTLPALLVGTYFRLFEVAIQKATTGSTSSSTFTAKREKVKTKKSFGGNKKRKSFGKKRSSAMAVAADSSSSSRSSMKSRLLSALLTGVNRAQPFLPDHDQQMEQHVHALYRVVHKAPPAACTQALLLLFHMAVGSKLMQTDSAAATPTATADNDDENDKNDSRRIRRNNKKRLQEESSKSRQEERQERGLSDKERSRQDEFFKVLYSRLSANSGMLLLSGGKHLTLFFNLLYKAMKYDVDSNRVLAYGKRLLCTTLHGPSTVLAASIYLLNEIGSRHHPILLTCFYSVLPPITEDSTSRILILNAREQDPRKAIVTLAQAEATNSRRHNANNSDSTLTTEDDGSHDNQKKKKKPLVTAPSWELALTMNHYHPSVASFAQHMGAIQYSGDPLRDFAVGPFLDKFAYKNPKQVVDNNNKTVKDDNAQQQQQQKVKSIAARRNPATVTQQMAVPLNDPSFLKKNDVHVQDEFFHRFFVEQARRDEIKGIVRYKATTCVDAAKRHGDMDDEDDEMAQQRAQEVAEEAALDAAEAAGDGGREKFDYDSDNDDDNDKEDAFAAYEAQWETDQEEEAFVDQLAQSIIEDAAIGANTGGPGELEGEDPDMDDWGDLNDDDNDDSDDSSGSDSDDDDDGVEELVAAEEAEMDQFGPDNPQDGVSFGRFFGDEDDDELQRFEETESSNESDDDDDEGEEDESQSDDDSDDDAEYEEEDSNHRRKKARA